MDRDCEMLDIGAGTGIIGRQLKEQGFSNMWALDASERFVQDLKSGGVYKDVYQRFLGMGKDNLAESFWGRFDVITASGVFLLKHMPKEAIDDCHTMLKPDGYLVTAMRSNLWVQGEQCGYRDKIDELIDSGKFKLTRTKDFMRGTVDGKGLFGLQQSILVVL